MKRYESKIEDEVLYVEQDGGWLSIGAIEEILDLVGGEEYSIEYGRQEAAYAEWLDTDEDDVMTIDVQETLASMSYPGAFIEELQGRSSEANGQPPERTRYFVDVMTDVWDSKGNLDDSNNPFQ